MKTTNELFNADRRAQRKHPKGRYYNINSLLGNDWAMFYAICGSRKTGKSYALADFICRQHQKYGENVKNYWMRISDTSIKALLLNKAQGLIDPDLQRKYNLDLTTKGMYVYNRGKPFCTVMPLSSFGKLKGVGFYDKDFTGYINIVLDEFQLEIGERRTSFDILYNFMGMVENIARTTKTKLRIFLLGNTLEEASTILKAFNFLPERFGRFYLKSKKCVIDNIEPTDEYLADREGSASDILGGKGMSNYTNALTKDKSLITNERLRKPTAIIKFTKEPNNWYVVWDGKIIRRYNKEKIAKHLVIAMRPYLNEYYNPDSRKEIIDKYDARYFKFRNLIDQSYFQGDLELIRKL